MLQAKLRDKIEEMASRHPSLSSAGKGNLMRANMVLRYVTDTREERLALCAELFDRPVSSTKELTAHEVLAFNELAYGGSDNAFTWVPNLDFVRDLAALKEGLAHDRT